LDINATRTYLQGVVSDFVGEIQLMQSLKGIQNIVSVEDYKVVEKAGEIGWDIYIRMELLTPFNTYITNKKLSEKEVIKLGCDICTVLEICAKRNIIHRDIKPENIFINDFGYFKLGDFGIARKMENMTGGLSQKGSPNYMAPEVTNGSEYDARVDTYSLGIVLYRLLNGNRLPFLDTETQLLNPNERRIALDRRLRGEKLPAPSDASAAMADLILRACAYDPGMRFASATEMKQALLSVANGTYRVVAATSLDKTTSVRKAPDGYDQTVSVRKAPEAANQKPAGAVNTFGTPKKKKSVLPAVIVAVLVIGLVVGGGIFAISTMLGGLGGSGKDDHAGTAGQAQGDEEQIAAIVAEAEALAAAQDYEGALEKVNAGLVTYPKSENLKNKSEEWACLFPPSLPMQTEQ
jgi:serine/threonine protein kinase